MSKRVQVELGPVQETLLIPLLGRAEQTKKGSALIRDPKAVEIVDALEYDFSKWRGGRSLIGACIRTRMFDAEVKEFLEHHPEGTVVEIGAGLNTRYERLDNGRARWLELDLPDSMALRRRFFRDTERRSMLAASVLDTDWHEHVLALPRPYCLVSEAVLIYLQEGDVERTLRGLSARLPGAWLITDTTSSAMVDGQHTHDAMKKLPQEAWFRWKCDDPKTIEPWGLRLEHSRSFIDAPADVRAALPWSYRLLFGLAPWLVRGQVDGYRINRFHLSGAGSS